MADGAPSSNSFSGRPFCVRAALEAGCEVADVGWVEANGRADVDGAKLAALDQALDSPRMDVEEVSCLASREQPRDDISGARLRQDATRSDRATRL